MFVGNIIPTTFREKLPRILSYPIGAEATSEVLQNVTQFSGLTLTFLAHCGATTPNPQKLRELFKQGPHEVFAVTYHHIQPGLSTPREFFTTGAYNERWGLYVYAVLSELKAPVREALMNDGLPRISDWLSAPRTEVWRYGGRRCQVLFSEHEGAIDIKESKWGG